jgi:hypothetical protein
LTPAAAMVATGRLARPPEGTLRLPGLKVVLALAPAGLYQLTANAGANLRELMARMGHDSERAALIYLHSTAERQRALADAVGETARADLARPLSHLAREWHETRVRPLRLLNDLRPDRDSNAGPTA